MTDSVPEERLSAERLAEWRETAHEARRSGAGWASVMLTLLATIDDLTAERDALAERVDVMHEVDEGRCAVIAGLERDVAAYRADNAGAELDRLRARAAADTPKLQAAQRLVDVWRARRGGAIARPIDSEDDVRAIVSGFAEQQRALENLAAAFTEEPEGPQPERVQLKVDLYDAAAGVYDVVEWNDRFPVILSPEDEESRIQLPDALWEWPTGAPEETP